MGRRKAISDVFDFLDNHLHVPGPQLVPYGYFYMSLASYFFRNQNTDYDLLKKYFWYYSFHREDLLSNTTQLSEHIQKMRVAKSGNTFEFGRFLIDRDGLRNTTYSSRGRLSRAILALYANQDPKDWRFPDRSVLTSVYYSLTDQPNLHHIFPLNFCETVLGKRGRAGNSLLNIAYLTQLTNLQISDRNPVEYVKDYAHHRIEIERTHLLPGELFGWALAGSVREDALDTFIDARLDLLLERLRRYLDGIPFEVVDTRSSTKDPSSTPQDVVSHGSQAKEPAALRESLLQIGAEGGSVTIFRERKAGDVWWFHMKTEIGRAHV